MFRVSFNPGSRLNLPAYRRTGKQRWRRGAITASRIQFTRVFVRCTRHLTLSGAWACVTCTCFKRDGTMILSPPARTSQLLLRKCSNINMNDASNTKKCHARKAAEADIPCCQSLQAVSGNDFFFLLAWRARARGHTHVRLARHPPPK